jgi:glycosyltransferase involved in cell wall biosynthesis
MRVSLCLLTWNEIEGCRLDVPRLPRDVFEEVFALDNGSSDGTVEYLQSSGIRVVRQQLPTYNGAYKQAFEVCTTEALVLFHPKGTIDPASLVRFRPLLEQGADLVVASRIGRGARNEEDDSWLQYRKWFVMSLGLTASLFWRRRGPMIWDVLHGYRAMRRDSFFAIEPLPRGVSMDLEMVARAYRKRMQVRTFPVQESPRVSGSTHFAAWATGKKLLRYLWLELRRRD